MLGPDQIGRQERGNEISKTSLHLLFKILGLRIP